MYSTSCTMRVACVLLSIHVAGYAVGSHACHAFHVLCHVLSCKCWQVDSCALARPLVQIESAPRPDLSCRVCGRVTHTSVMYSMYCVTCYMCCVSCKCWQVESALWPDHLFVVMHRQFVSNKINGLCLCSLCSKAGRFLWGAGGVLRSGQTACSD